MKKVNLIIIGLMFLVLFSSLSFGADDRTKVENVITSSYFNGAFNDLDTESMRKGFHPDFAIFSAKGNEISRYPIDTWIKGIEQGKHSPDFDKSQAKMDCKIASLDITAGCAAAKIEISKNGKMVYTDYLSLLKFEDGWKIVAKVYHAHPRQDR
ncbi:MAG: nuclear transport factor 2 family protein [Candidatus Aminicenantaceae bacterium]